MATCEVSGTSDMYGLGIRVGFYLQWMSSPATAWIAPGETSSLRTANAFFISATFIGLIIETALNHLDVIEIYVILLLGFAWNKIQGVNDTKSVGQLIPLMIGVGGIGHVVLAVIRGPKTVDEIMQEYYQEDSYNMMVMGASASNGREE
ncbi:unnamed protein product [Alternaria alternata]